MLPLLPPTVNNPPLTLKSPVELAVNLFVLTAKLPVELRVPATTVSPDVALTVNFDAPIVKSPAAYKAPVALDTENLIVPVLVSSALPSNKYVKLLPLYGLTSKTLDPIVAELPINT